MLLDIKDGFEPSSSVGYTAGYFYPVDMYSNTSLRQANINIKSNETDMLYIDIYPGVPDSETTLSTVAHEFQHLVNFGVSARRRSSVMDTWIDEGLSTAAEHLYLGKICKTVWTGLTTTRLSP